MYPILDILNRLYLVIEVRAPALRREGVDEREREAVFSEFRGQENPHTTTSRVSNNMIALFLSEIVHEVVQVVGQVLQRGERVDVGGATEAAEAWRDYLVLLTLFLLKPPHQLLPRKRTRLIPMNQQHFRRVPILIPTLPIPNHLIDRLQREELRRKGRFEREKLLRGFSLADEELWGDLFWLHVPRCVEEVVISIIGVIGPEIW